MKTNPFDKLQKATAESGLPSASIIHMSLLHELRGGGGKSLGRVAHDVDRTPSSLKYAVGAMVCSGYVCVDKRQLYITASAADTLKALPPYTAYLSGYLHNGMTTVMAWQLLWSIQRSAQTVNAHAEAIGYSYNGVRRTIDRMLAGGMVHIPTTYDAGREVLVPYLTNRGEDALKTLFG